MNNLVMGLSVILLINSVGLLMSGHERARLTEELESYEKAIELCEKESPRKQKCVLIAKIKQ